MKKSEAALVTINKAMTIDPKNPLCKFHRASILFSMDKHQVKNRLLCFLNSLSELCFNLKTFYSDFVFVNQFRPHYKVILRWPYLSRIEDLRRL